MNNRNKIQLARDFRKNPTGSEKIMWEKLRRNNFSGLYFRRQHIINGFIIDFYCPKLKLAIEIDGEIHNNQIKEDIERQKIIEDEDINFFRVESKEIESNLNQVFNRLNIFIKNKFKI